MWFPPYIINNKTIRIQFYSVFLLRFGMGWVGLGWVGPNWVGSWVGSYGSPNWVTQFANNRLLGLIRFSANLSSLIRPSKTLNLKFYQA